MTDSDSNLADQIVRDGINRYFAERRRKVVPFVDRNFSLRGSIGLHRAAAGWDLARGPLNVAMGAPQIALLAASGVARRLGAKDLETKLRGTRLVVHTAVGKELAWRLHTELLELPYTSGNRVSTRDALTETILADHRIDDVLEPAVAALTAHRHDPALRQRVEQAMTEYARTRTAATEIATGLLNLSVGGLALRKLTPGAMTLGAALASSMARKAAIMSFPAGWALGAVWTTVVPAAPPALLAAGLTGGVFAASTVATAFAGILADPVQRRLGLHEARLRRMLDAIERQMKKPGESGSRVHDHYVARLLDLFDVAGTLVRVAGR